MAQSQPPSTTALASSILLDPLVLESVASLSLLRRHCPAELLDLAIMLLALFSL